MLGIQLTEFVTQMACPGEKSLKRLAFKMGTKVAPPVRGGTL